MTAFGGYEDAERQMAGFCADEIRSDQFPMNALMVSWPKQAAPAHRDLLGSVMGLGIQRHMLGDIVLLKECAYLFVQSTMAQHVADSWLSAGKTQLRVALAGELPMLECAAGTEKRDTVASLRLDALVASGFDQSRTKAADWISAGKVKLCHIQSLRSDARVECGDVISVRGMGRLQLTMVGNPTRKGRLPITLMRFGNGKS